MHCCNHAFKFIVNATHIRLHALKLWFAKENNFAVHHYKISKTLDSNSLMAAHFKSLKGVLSIYLPLLKVFSVGL